jgi:immunity protein 52 of polymorphic toxin system
METDRLTFANQFTIESRWKPREESPEELGERTLHCLDAISPLHPAFRDWEFLHLSRDAEEMTEENCSEFAWPLEDARQRMTEVVVEWGVSIDDLGMPEPRQGYSVSVSNGHDEPSQLVTLSAHGGGLVNWTGSKRYASFETNMAEEADPAIVSYPVFKSVLMAIISCWDVEFAQVYSSDLVQLWEPILPLCNLSWMVYLSAPLTRLITVPTDVVVERLADGGLIMIAAEETFDVANPAHIARARSILNALEPLNAEEAEREAKRGW